MIHTIFGGQPPAEVDENLWQSGYPLNGDQLKPDGFDVLVLCSEELQVEPDEAAEQFPGVKVIAAPFEDTGDRDVFPEILRTAGAAARKVVAELSAGRRVLVTCTQGRNRSGLVSALALVLSKGMTGAEAMERVKQARRNALTNPLFAEYLAWKKPRSRR
jgi:protein-tyrosine phosphatase